MARGSAFGDIQVMLRETIGRSSSAGTSASDAGEIKRAINRAYKSLYEGFEWPHLRKVFTKIPMQAGDRYYDFPSGLNLERVEEVWTWYNDEPHRVARGIGLAEYSGYDSEADERSDPILKWDVRWTGTEDQIEVWPVPASATDLQFVGIQAAPALVDDDDLCLLDDELVVLTAAVPFLERQKSPDANTTASQARDLRLKLQGNQSSGSMARVGLPSADTLSRGHPRARIVISG